MACCWTWRGRCGREGRSILAMGHVNVIWQGDANAMSIAIAGGCDESAVCAERGGAGGIAGEGMWAERLGDSSGKKVTLVGEEAPMRC